MPDDQRPMRRRRRPHPAVPAFEEAQAAEPLRIIVGREADEPDWVVSAGKITGAASRRVQPKHSEKGTKEAAGDPGKKEGPMILKEKKAAPARSQEGKSARQTAGEKKTQAGKTTGKTAAPARKSPKKPAPRSPKKKLSKKARERRNRQIKRVTLALLGTALAVVILAVGIIGGSRLMDIKQTLDRGDGVFYPNIFVNNIPLEGRTLDEAASIVTQQVMTQIASFKITLRTQDGRSWDITGDDLQMKYDVADQLDQLWAIGHTGSSSERYEQVKALEEEPAVRYTTLSYDLSRVNQILTQIKNEVDTPAVSATRVDDDTKWPPFSYTDDIPGQTLDITGLNEEICDMVDRLESGVVDLTPTPVEATVTREALEAQIVMLGTYETTIGKSGEYAEARQENIRIGTEKFNRLIIKSGESVSFNKVTGRRSAENGYQMALEIVYGNYVPGYGGGICQVSSTLYNAVKNAGLEVTKRTPHAIPSSDVPKGLDATVADDRYDLVFKNTTGADIYLEAGLYRENNYWHTYFTIYGRPDPNGYSYKLESEVVETIPLPDPEYRQDTNGEYVIYDDETYQSSEGREGYVVDVYLITMDANGLEVSREWQYQDTYRASAPVIYVGVTPRETPTPEPISID